MVDSTFSERGWWWTGRILEKSMSCLISIYFKDMRMVPEKLRKSEGTISLVEGWLQESGAGLIFRFPQESYSLLGQAVPIR